MYSDSKESKAPIDGACTPWQIEYRCCAIYQTEVQYQLLVFTFLKVLEGPIHEGNQLETSNCI
jgi:hypothetical protein